MKKLLFILSILWVFGIQTAKAQCAQPYEMTMVADYKVWKNIDPYTYFYSMPSNGQISKELVTPDGNLFICGPFDKVCQYDGTDTGITQTLQVPSGLAKRDAVTGIWSALPIPTGAPAGSKAYGIWFLNNNIHAFFSTGFGGVSSFRSFNAGTNTWSSPIVFTPEAFAANSIISTGNPFEFYVTRDGWGTGGGVAGVKKWNSQTNVVTDLQNSLLPDGTSNYSFYEGQIGDTVFVKFDDLFTNFQVLIKGQSALLPFDSIDIINPSIGFNGGFGLGSITDVIKLSNNEIYAHGQNLAIQMSALIKWNSATHVWDSICVHNGASSEAFRFFYDTIDHKLHVNGYGIVDEQTGVFTSVPSGLGISAPCVASLRQGNKLYAFGGSYSGRLEDKKAPTEPNTIVPNGIVQLIGAQNVNFIATNGHEGDLAKMYAYGAVVDSIPIDATNCSNFVFSRFLNIGTHVYDFTLTDPYGNESPPTTITINVSWPTGTEQVTEDFVSVYAGDKRIYLKGTIGRVEIYNITGQVIFSQTVNATVFTQSFDALPSGMYILKVQSTDGNFIKRKITL